MRVVEKVSLDLTPEMAATVREAERRGEHLSPSEVVRDALCMWRAYQAFRADEADGLRRARQDGVAAVGGPRAPPPAADTAEGRGGASDRQGPAVAAPTPAAPVEPCASCEARQFSVCGALSAGQIERLASITTVLRFAPHEPIVHPGTPAEHLFNITGGTAQAYRLLADGRRQITSFLFRGDFVGFAAGQAYAYAYGVEAVTAVTACRFPRQRFRAVLETFPAMERRLLAIAAGEIAAAQEQMVLLGRKTARERTASFLLMLARRHAATPVAGGGEVVPVPMSRGEIADYLGLTTETVSRAFSRLRDERVIRLRGKGEVLIADRQALEAIAAG